MTEEGDESDWGMVCSNAFRAPLDACAEWRRRLHANPSDVDARVRLIGAGFGSDDEQVHEMRAESLIWLYTYRPDIDLSAFATTDHEAFPDEYARVRDHLVSLLEDRPVDLVLLQRAALFVARAQPQQAASWYERGARSQPQSSWWREQLAALWQREARHDPTNAASLARRAWSEYEAALVLSERAFTRYSLTLNIARAAYDAGEPARARQAAEQSLAEAAAHERTWIYGNAIHDANLVLGMLALDRGDTPAAEAHLEAAGTTRGSPQLNSFGPDLTLVARFLALGWSDAVVRYFRACQRFWQLDGGCLQRWIEAIERGQNPDLSERYIGPDAE